jgi:hypothetical protein
MDMRRSFYALAAAAVLTAGCLPKPPTFPDVNTPEGEQLCLKRATYAINLIALQKNEAGTPLIVRANRHLHGQGPSPAFAQNESEQMVSYMGQDPAYFLWTNSRSVGRKDIKTIDAIPEHSKLYLAACQNLVAHKLAIAVP